MQYPVTTFPGNHQGLPMSATDSLFGRTPMFSGDPGPRYTGPFNLSNGQGGPMLQMLAPMLLQGFMGSGNFPAQFNPEQNLYDQYKASQFYNSGQHAMRTAAERDTRAMENTLGGITQMFTGQPLSEVQSSRNFKLAQGISQFTPLLTQMLGPDLVDKLHGSRGSATVFAQQFQQAMRTGLDPITGQATYSGESSGNITQELYERLFNENYDPTELRGMSAGQAGMVINELQTRGLMGKSIGSLSVQEQRGAVRNSLDQGTIDRIAKSVLAANDISNPNAEQIAAARNQVQESHRQIKNPKADMTLDEMHALPGGQEIIRAADADRIAGRLKNMAGAVKAMRDIFGDMGNPNAPMREIINGLDALTQGGLATMSASAVESMVRKTHNIAKQTGVGVQGMIGLTAQYANTTDQLGLDRSFAVRAAQQSALFGAAAADANRLDMPVWGAMTKEQLTLMDGQLRMHAAASPLANQLGSIMRMSETGMIDPSAGSELSNIVEAIRNGQKTYEFDGKQHSLAIRRSKLFDVLERDAGLSRNESQAIILDRFGNQEFSQEFNTDQITRDYQIDEMIHKAMAPAVGNRLRNVLQEDGVSDLLIGDGTLENDREFGVMMQRIGAGMSSDFMKMDPTIRKDNAKRRRAMRESFKMNLRKQLKANLPEGTPAAEIDAKVAEIVELHGGETGLTGIAESSFAEMNAVFYKTPYKSAQAAADAHSPGASSQAAIRERQAEADSIMQTALAPLGTSGPIRRVADALQGATGDTTWHELLSDTLGGVDMKTIEQHDPTGKLAQLFGLIDESGKLDVSDAAQFKKLKRNAAVIQGLGEGGEYATKAIAALDNSQERVSVADSSRTEQDAAIERLHKADAQTREQQSRQLKHRERQVDQVTRTLEQMDETTDPTKKMSLEKVARRQTGQLLRDVLGDEELDLGDGRKLTRKGIVGPDDKVTKVDADNIQEVRDALKTEITRRQDTHAAETGRPDTRSREEQLEAASKKGLLLKEMPDEIKELRQALADLEDPESEKAKDIKAKLEEMVGTRLSMQVKDSEINAIGDLGDQAVEALDDDMTDETQAVMRTFVDGTRVRAKQLLRDDTSMAQLGKGGLDLVRGAMGMSTQLQKMAEEKGVSVEELVRQSPEARKVFDTMRSQWSEVQRRREFGVLPGQGLNKENQRRLKMTDEEKEDLEAEQAFLKQGSAEDRASDVFDRLVGMTDSKTKARLNVDVNKDRLMEAIMDGDRSVTIDRALRGRDSIIEMAMEKGVFGDKKITELTTNERAGAYDRLSGLKLDDDERSDLQRFKQMSDPLSGLDRLNPGDAAVEILQRINQFSGVEVPIEDNQDQKLAVTVKGNIKLLEDGTADVTMDGEGLMNTVHGTSGVV